jgi:predicted RNA-binding protein with PIN domain
MSSLLLVDGHSALFSSDDLAEEHARSPRHARQLLIDRLNTYQDATNQSVAVVFDGQGPEQTAEGGSEGEVLVIYSSRGTSADAVIERIAARMSPKRRVTVASNDRMVLDAASASGSESISIRSMNEEIDRALGRFRSRWGLG